MNNTNIVQRAEKIKALHLSPVPLENDKKGEPKKPIGLKWQKNRYEPSQFQNASGIGIHTGRFGYTDPGYKLQLPCLDLDIKAVPEQFHSELLTNFQECLTENKFIEQSRSGGLHAFYLVDMNGAPMTKFSIKSRALNRPVIEILAEGQQVAISPTPGYTVMDGDIEHIPCITMDRFNEMVQDLKNVVVDLDEKLIEVGICPGVNSEDPGNEDQPRDNVKDLATAELYVKEIERLKIDMTADPDEWALKVGFPLASCGERARDLFHRVSQFYHVSDEKKYDPEETDKMFDHFVGDYRKEGKRVTIATFFDFCHKHGIRPTIDTTTEDSLSELYIQNRITTQTAIEKPETLIDICGDPILTKGDVSTLAGKAKSRKTTLLTAIVISVFIDLYGELLRSHFTEGKILFVDTEQSKYWTSVIIQRLKKLGISDAEIDERLILVNYRNLDFKRYRELTEYILNKEKICLAILDGSRDFVNDINNADESSDFVRWILSLPEKYGAGVINALHFNKNDKNLRGHLGSELTNKSEYVISVEKDEGSDHSVVSPLFARGIEFKKLELTIEDNIPSLKIHVDNSISSEQRKPSSYTPEEHEKILSKALGEDELSQRVTTRAVKKAIEQILHIEIGNHTVREEWLYFYEDNSMVSTRKQGQSVLYKYNQDNE